MAVSWVAGTAPVHVQNNNVSANAPSGIADFDLLFAAVFALSPITAPAGWTKRSETATFDDSDSVTGRLELWQKNSVTTADASTSFNWVQDDFENMAVAYACVRGAFAVDTESTSSEDLSADWSITIPTLAGTATGQMLLSIAACTDAGSFSSETRTPVVPSGTTLGTGTPSEYYRVAIAYRTANSGDSISGAFAMHNTGSPPTQVGLGAISVRLSAAGATPEGIISAVGPLGAPAILTYIEPNGWISDTGPLGVPLVLGQHDFTSFLGDALTSYRMDIETPDGAVRLPISSWQATLQTARQCYVQCVVPACAPYVDDLNAATAFAILRHVELSGGQVIESWMAGADITNLQFSQGSANYTAVISGYSEAFAEDEDPPESLDRTMTGIRTISSSNGTTRAKCNIDWLLRPGGRAIVNGDPLLVGWINYYVNDSDSFMEVGERSESD